jgi:aldose 1-epimerase
MSIESFGTARTGEPVALHTLEGGGLRARIATLGATLVTLEVPDRAGRLANVLLGLPTLADYEATDAYFGATVGRFANRIGGGRFTLDGTPYRLPANEGANTLHGGPGGFDKKVWTVTAAEPARLALRHVSPDGDNGFPGTLTFDATFALEDGALRIDYAATTDRPTVFNPACHAYFNLAGEGTGDILDHEFAIFADAFLPTDPEQIPTGEIQAVAGTPLDLREPTPLRPRIRGADPQLRIARGFDHNYVLPPGSGLRRVARVHEPGSGRRLEVSTTQPGLQFYSGNSLDGSALGRSGRCYRQGDGFCFEAQAFPDAPNHPAFPSAVLRPGERYAATTVYAFASA